MSKLKLICPICESTNICTTQKDRYCRRCGYRDSTIEQFNMEFQKKKGKKA